MVGRQLVDAPIRWDFQEVNKLMLILALSWLPIKGENWGWEKGDRCLSFLGRKAGLNDVSLIALVAPGKM